MVFRAADDEVFVIPDITRDSISGVVHSDLVDSTIDVRADESSAFIAKVFVVLDPFRDLIRDAGLLNRHGNWIFTTASDSLAAHSLKTLKLANAKKASRTGGDASVGRISPTMEQLFRNQSDSDSPEII